MIEKNIKSNVGRRIFGTGVFSLTSTSVVTAQSIAPYLPMFQEKLLYATLSLVVFFVIRPKIRSRVSYVLFLTSEGGEEK